MDSILLKIGYILKKKFHTLGLMSKSLNFKEENKTKFQVIFKKKKQIQL